MEQEYKPGTLVRVRDSAVDEDSEHWTMNKVWVRDHGYLWFIIAKTDEETVDGEVIYDCRSLATAEMFPWTHFEIEGADDGET